MRTLLAVVVLIVVFASQALAADMGNGKNVYVDKCLKCHGEKGKGDGPEAADLEKKPADYTDKAKMGKFTDEELKKVVREGKKPMAAFGKKLTPKEIDDVLAYIRTFAK